MSLPYTILDWETCNFGYKVARCNPHGLNIDTFEAVKKSLLSNSISLAYFFIDPADPTANDLLLSGGCTLADQKVTFHMELNPLQDYRYSDHIQPYPNTFTTDTLRKLALQSGIYSRFKTDPQFTNNEYEILYNAWIDKSVNREIADEVLAYYIGEEEKGFISLLVKNTTGSIGLLSVDENERGNSIGKELVLSALSYFISNGLPEAEVVTQLANQVACRFYSNMGFEIKKIENIYHLWMKS